jgi:hypothetical protein
MCKRLYIDALYSSPAEDKVFIYSLANPETNEIRYVGKTKLFLAKRLSQHIANIKKLGNYRCKSWIKSLQKNGLQPKIELIDEVLMENWESEEIFYISYLKYLGFKLTNHSEGGLRSFPNYNPKIRDTEAYKKKMQNIYINRDIGYKLYDVKGVFLKYFKNKLEMSNYFNVSLDYLKGPIYDKTLINKKYFILHKDEIFDEKMLNKSPKIVKVTKFDSSVILFNSQKECADSLNITLSRLNRIIHKTRKNTTNYKFELI